MYHAVIFWLTKGNLIFGGEDIIQQNCGHSRSDNIKNVTCDLWSGICQRVESFIQVLLHHLILHWDNNLHVVQDPHQSGEVKVRRKTVANHTHWQYTAVRMQYNKLLIWVLLFEKYTPMVKEPQMIDSRCAEKLLCDHYLTKLLILRDSRYWNIYDGQRR